MVYKVTGEQRDRLLELAREADQPGWWERSSSGLPTQLAALIGFESEAIRITDVSLAMVPGLLQTSEYARALLTRLTDSSISKTEIETRLVARLGRQAILSKPSPPKYLAILDEAVLRRPVGGRHVMAAQVRHIIRTSQRPNVTVQVIPFDHGEHAGLNGSYLLLEFNKARTLVHLEHRRSTILVDEPADIEPFIEMTETLHETALDSTHSAEFLTSIATEYER